MCRRSPQSESGYILLAVLFMVVLILIGLAVAAPRIAADIQRDREDDLLHRGLQYKRAIKLYNKKFGGYPSSINQLENTNKIRFLRKRYVDPMTGKDDWKIIHLGEAHVKPLGLFGQPIQGAGMPGAPGAGIPGAPGGGSAYGGTSGMGTSPLGSTSSFGGSSSTGSTSSTSTGTDPSSGTNTGTPGTTSTPGNTTGTFGSPTGTGTSTFGGQTLGGQTFGGGPMVGVVSKSTKASIKEYKKQKHYNEWEFVYDPVEDLLSSVSLLGGGGGTPNNLNGPGSSGTTPGSSTSGFPGSTNPGAGTGTPFGGNPTSGSGTPMPTPPTSPQ